MKREEREADRIRRQLDLAALVAEIVPLVRSGSRLIGPCPFCEADDDRESLELFASEGMFVCSECGRQGDCFKWCMLVDGLTFAEALRATTARLNPYRCVA